MTATFPNLPAPKCNLEYLTLYLDVDRTFREAGVPLTDVDGTELMLALQQATTFLAERWDPEHAGDCLLFIRYGTLWLLALGYLAPSLSTPVKDPAVMLLPIGRDMPVPLNLNTRRGTPYRSVFKAEGELNVEVLKPRDIELLPEQV